MDTTPDLIFDEPHQSHFGYLPENCRDLNGDGFIDFSVSADVNWEGYAKVYVYFGGPDLDTEADLIFYPDTLAYQAEYGKYVDMGDFNGDGYFDLIVGDSRYEIIIGSSAPGRNDAYIFEGGNPINTQWNTSLSGSGDTETACEFAGDINNDGWPDVMTGDHLYSGIVNVFFLSPELGSSHEYDLEFQYPGFGMHMGYAGDVNGDGVDDFWMSSWDDDWRGEVFIYSDPTLSVRNPEIELSIPDFIILPAYPNPFNTSTTIPFTLDRAGRVELRVFDALGRSVGAKGISPAFYPAGYHEIVWNAEEVASGIYLVRLSVDGLTDKNVCPTRKVVLMR